jgi:aminopeptidase N
MKHILKFLLYLLLVNLLTSCAVIGINTKLKTPSKPGKYPEFTRGDSLIGQITPYRSAYDADYYDLNIEIHPESKTISGHADMYFTAVNDFDTIQVDLYENLKINKITYKNKELRYYRFYKAVFIVFDEEIRQGEKEMISVYYEGKPVIAPKPPWKGGFVWKKDRKGNPWIGVACELAGASLWWPVKDHISDEPDSMRISATVPSGLFCVSNGTLISQSITGNQVTFVWKTRYPINTYNATVYVGDFRHFQLPYVTKDTSRSLDFYVLPSDLEKAQTHFRQAADIIGFYESSFGEYPWWSEGYKLVESPYEGMEHQTAIAYGNRFRDFPGYDFDYIILHETAHEWWGNSLSACDYAEIWLQEGFATYSEALYVEHTRGYDEYLRYLSLYSIFIKNKRPVIGPYGVNYWDYKDTDVYLKGALLLHTLRNIINNDTVFFDIIRTFYGRYQYAMVTTQNFIDIVNEKTGMDLGWFFNQYLYSRVCPRLEWNYIYNNVSGQPEFRYKWLNIDSYLPIPVTIKTGQTEYTVTPSPQVQVLRFSTGYNIRVNTKCSYVSLKKNKSL